MAEEVQNTGDSKLLVEKDESEGHTTLKVPSSGEKRKLSETSATPKFTVKPKISMNISGSQQKKTIGVSLKLGSDPKKQKTEPALVEKKGSVASAFNEESDDEEEMPAEAKMRMRNVGRNTPTSAGPNSYNKGNKGFTDHRKAGEKSFKLEHPSRSKEAKQ
ncbi:PEST proteolytic signal-containing nuclear protein-like [Pocillopora verrucosa]|uniref:PEST proteolytic signal-containing nuclear protein-like n=1 Tax=Pocillopora verrucosa TaxID=203993 RepID=UPI0033425EA1